MWSCQWDDSGKIHIMKQTMKFFLVAICCFVTLVSVASSGHNDGKVQELEYEVDNGKIVRIKDRSRYFDELTIVNPISTELHDVKNEDGKNVGKLYPLQHASIRRLVIDNRNGTISRIIGGKKFETISLTGVRDLEEIVFKGPIIPFHENTKWLGIKKDSDWRKSLKKVVFEDSLDFEFIPFLADIYCIALGTNTCSELENLSKSEKICNALSRCKKLEKLLVPYSLACNTNIRWSALIGETGLKGKEVLSQMPLDSSEGDLCDRVLLSIASSGEISDAATKIRTDAIERFEGRRIFLPYGLNEIIGGGISTRQREKFTLKKNSVLFYPEINSLTEKRKIQKGRSLFSFCGVTITSPYNNIEVRVNGKIQEERVEKKKKGCAYITKFELSRIKGEENSVQLGLNIGSEIYPVAFYDMKGVLFEKPIKVVFEKESLGFIGVAGMVFGWLLLSFTLTAVCIWRGRKLGVENTWV